MNRKSEITISIILIMIVLGITLRVYINSKEYDCEKCIINFQHRRVLEQRVYEINYSIIKLHEGYVNDECLIFWDKTNGYMSSSIIDAKSFGGNMTNG